MNKLKEFLAGTVLCMIFGFVGFYMMKTSYEAQERYEIEHNCKFDYNDLCYTYEERPYLFK